METVLELKFKKCPRCERELLKTGEFWCLNCARYDGVDSICKECKRAYMKEHKAHDPEKFLAVERARAAKYREQNREKVNGYVQKYRDRNRDLCRKRDREQRKKRYQNDLLFRLHDCFSVSLRECLRTKGIVKKRRCFEIMGYSLEDLKTHLESQFESWMNWDNHGNYSVDRRTWQIDHIIPKSAFHFGSYEDEEFKRCWALENLRPLGSFENMSKGNRMEKGS